MKKIAVMFIAIVMLLTVSSVPSHAEKADKPAVLVVYSSDDESDHEQLKILDLLLGQFTSDVTFIKDEDLSSIKNKRYSHMVYVGLVKKKIPSLVVQKLNSFDGSALAIGKNVEQLGKRFSFIQANGEAVITSAKLVSKNLDKKLSEKRIIVNAKPIGKVKTLITGQTKDGDEQLLMAQKGKDYYLATESFYDPIGQFVGEKLFSFFGKKPTGTHKVYLRLEDVHPMYDPEVLKQAADYLKKKDIPYMIAVIPLYINPKTHEVIHMSDSPKLVKVLQYMQDNGATIVLHGYRHQYKDEETGEGFEFWDVKRDEPILTSRNDDVKGRKDFETTADYRGYLKKGEAFERKYVENAMQSGIEELVTHKLYPLAFEAPHYAMSQTGYDVLSKHFSTYVGQTQVTDLTWTGQYAPLNESQPTFLNGMTLLPETIGYVSHDAEHSVDAAKSNVKEVSEFTDSYVAGFYHPYLKLSNLKELVESLDRVPNREWVDLKKLDNRVKVQNVTISSNSSGVKVDKSFIASSYERQYLFKKYGVWFIIGVVALLLACYYVFNRFFNKNKDDNNYI
ncbi:polysaccharide deacetylase family protein [Priestia koreensis]|uniref:polysaccharide deacetylase family protein n=1 Tax=Priestia koreensis TaxID=284581 RepID=UPI0006A9E89A|nr:polysaccharide deacetylase family protein [Priestia koreensis]MCM3002931.1 polysaccharide deacetylase family protein [Priestia koreensis]